MTNPPAPPITPGTASAAPAAAALFSSRHWIIYACGTLGFMVAFAVGLRVFRGAVDDYQVSQPRYAAERAIKALDEGKPELARQEIQTVLDDVPIRRTGGLLGRMVDDVWEGRVLRNRVTVLKALTGKLLAARMAEPAEAVGWKMMLEFHIASRVVELLDLWEWMFYVKAVNKDWTSAFEVLKILGAHGMGAYRSGGLREPARIEPDPVAVDPEIYRAAAANYPPELLGLISQFYQAEAITDYQGVANGLTSLRDGAANPAVRQKINTLIHRSLVKANRRTEAHRFLTKVWGRDLGFMENFWAHGAGKVDPQLLLDRDPTLMGMMWRDRPSGTTQTLSAFLDSFRGNDPRIRIIDFGKLRLKDIGYFNLNNKIYSTPEYMNLSQGVAASMPVQVTRTVHRVFIAYEATPALGLYPILLVRINNQPYIPLYCDSDKPDLVYFDTTLEGPAVHQFEFVYLNDAAFQVPAKGVSENRDLHLFRMALVQMPAAEKK